MIHEIELTGLDGSNPLAFLAALGTLRVLHLQDPENDVSLAWRMNRGAWRPTISSTAAAFDPDTILANLDDYLGNPLQAQVLQEIGPDLTVTGANFRLLCERYVQIAHDTSQPQFGRVPSDFLAAFGCDSVTQDDALTSLIQDTALRTMSGAGHQHFVQFMLEIIASTTLDHLRRALFEVWTYQDEGRGKNLRWDPQDDRRYALRWKNPSSDPNTTVRGANRLAIEALPLLTTAPVRGRLETTGFVQRRGDGVRWTWPVWSPRIDINVCRSLLQLAELQDVSAYSREKGEWRERLRRRGIVVVFQCQRITIGKFRSFAPARAILG